MVYEKVPSGPISRSSDVVSPVPILYYSTFLKNPDTSSAQSATSSCSSVVGVDGITSKSPKGAVVSSR